MQPDAGGAVTTLLIYTHSFAGTLGAAVPISVFFKGPRQAAGTTAHFESPSRFRRNFAGEALEFFFELADNI